MRKVANHFRVMISVITLLQTMASCNNSSKNDQVATAGDDLKQVNNMLDSFNIAAANADFNKYFSYYTDDAVFTGTDATERWVKKDFMVWSKPFFDRGKAWSFTSLERHVYFDKSGKLGWFDELLNTQMKICRGSGVVVKQGGEWKVQQYILSTTIPNDQMDTIIKMKAPLEDEIIRKLAQ